MSGPAVDIEIQILKNHNYAIVHTGCEINLTGLISIIPQ